MNDKQIRILVKKILKNKKFIKEFNEKEDFWTAEDSRAWKDFANSVEGLGFYAKKIPSTETFPETFLTKLKALLPTKEAKDKKSSNKKISSGTKILEKVKKKFQKDKK